MKEIVRWYADRFGAAGVTSIEKAIRLTAVGRP